MPTPLTVDKGVAIDIDYLVLADAAVAAAGKHYIHGAGWDALFASTFPVTHLSMGAALRVRVPWMSTNQPHDIELDVLDEDGISILADPRGPLRATINVGRPPTSRVGSDQTACLTFSLMRLQFPREGTYTVVARIDGIDRARSPFNVLPAGPEVHPMFPR